MKLTIELVANGWMLTDESDPEMPKKHVFEDTGSGSLVNADRESLEAFRRLLWSINDLLGPSTSRYSKDRIYIELKPGDKHEDYKDEDED